MVRRLISVDDDMRIPEVIRVSAENLPADYVQYVNGVRPDSSGNVEITVAPSPTNPSTPYKVLILNPDDPNPSAAGVATGTLIVRLSENYDGLNETTNVVILNPLDPKPDSATLPEGTLVLRLLPEEG